MLLAPAGAGAIATGGPRPQHFAVLERGNGWVLSVFRQRKLRCLNLEDPSGFSTDCHRLRMEQPDLGDWGDRSPGSHPARTWIVVETSLRVQRVHLDFYRGPARDIYPVAIGARRARKARVKNNFKYGVVSAKGCVAAQREAAYGYDGTELYSFPAAGVDISLPDDCPHPDNAAAVKTSNVASITERIAEFILRLVGFE